MAVFPHWMQSLCSVSGLVPFPGMYEASDYIPYGVERKGIVGNQIWKLSAYTRLPFKEKPC